MSDYNERTADHFDTLSYQPKPIPQDEFWERIERLTENGTALEAVKSAAQKLSLLETLRMLRTVNSYVEQLEKAINAAEARGALVLPEGDWWGAMHHAVFLGRARYEQEREDPALFVARINDTPSEDEWGFIFDHREALDRSTNKEIEEALRAGSFVCKMGDSAGLGDRELIEHPELGLGFIVLDQSSPWMWLVFRTTTLSTQRHKAPSRSITLYKESTRSFCYIGMGEVRYNAFDILTCSGGISAYYHQMRVYDPKPQKEAEAKFVSLLESFQREGFQEVSLPKTRLLLALSESGLGKNSSHHRQVSEAAARSLREHGLGVQLQQRLSREAAHLVFEVIDVEAAERAIRRCIDAVPDIGKAYSFVRLEASAPVESVPLPTTPCEVREDLAYFSKLSITPHPETMAWAEREAKEAIEAWTKAHKDLLLDGSLESLDRLDTLISLLQERHEKNQLSIEERERYAAQIGSYAGEILRAAVDGAWGVGALFSERLWFGLLLGVRRIKWWPVREASEHLQKKLHGSFAKRCKALLEKAKIPMPEGPSRLYPLAANEGYFDAGLTRDGRQALMAVFYTNTFAFFFDQEGYLLEYATRPELPGRPEGQPSYGPSRMALEAWQKELGFVPKLIRVRRFSSAEQYVGIEDLISHYRDFIEDPESEKDPKEREELFASIQRWVESGAFVLYWGNDLWLNDEGHVTSS